MNAQHRFPRPFVSAARARSNLSSRGLRLIQKTTLIAALAAGSAGCARPNYINAPLASLVSTPHASAEAHCDVAFRQAGLCAEWSWRKLPSETDPGTFLVKLVRANLGDGTPIPVDLPTDTTLAVDLWMPSMGHGSTPVTITRVDTGTYLVSEVFFIMRGQWEIHFQIAKASGIADTAAVNVTF